MSGDILLVIVVGTALAFDFTNGFHDTANVVATSISTRAIGPKQAVAFASLLNFVGAFISLKVATTIAKGFVDTDAVTTTVVFCGLVGAIAWNVITWYFGLPSSSSHALIGGLVGSVVAASGWSAVNGGGIVDNLIVPAIIAPIIAFVGAGASILLVYQIVGRLRPGPVSRGFRLGELASGGLLALSHGTNDAQKTMGVITLALVANGNISAASFHIPDWVVVTSASAISLGTFTGGWRIIKTLGTRIISMDPAQGFAAQGAGAAVILAASSVGYPLSTTARHLRRDHGRWGGQALLGRPLGRSRQHRRRVGHDATRGRAAGRARVWRHHPVRQWRGRPDRGHDRVAGRPGRNVRAAAPARPARTDHDMIRAAIDTSALLKMLYSSLLASIFVAVVFSTALLGAIRASDMRRAGRAVAATAYTVLAALGLLLASGVIVYGLVLIARKS